MRVADRFNIKGRGWIVVLEPQPAECPRVGDVLVAGATRYAIRGVESHRVGDGSSPPYGLLVGSLAPDVGVAVQIEKDNKRTAGGAPLDPEEAALLAALRARGLNELAEMALHCFGESYGHAPTALREFDAASPQVAPCSMVFTHCALTPGVECPSCHFLAPAPATGVQAVVRALREKADWRQQHGDDPGDLRNFADSIDPTSEEYDPNLDPLVSR